MAREIPEVVRAVAGLAATVLDEARKLPETLPGLPVRIIGQALQVSLKLQQQYSGLVARGDELFTGLRGDHEPGLATFDDDLPAPARTVEAADLRSSPFDRVGDLPTDTVAEELTEELTEELAEELVEELAAADLVTDESALVLAFSADDDAADLTPAEVADLPDDPIADAVTAVVDEVAADVAAEIAEDVPAAVPDEVLEDLTADTVAEVAEDEAAVEEAVAEELIADAAVGGTPPAPDAPAVPTLDDVTPDQAPEQTEIVDDVEPDVEALDEAADELVDLGGPEAAESVTPGSGITDSAASDPLVPPARTRPSDTATDERPTDTGTTDTGTTDTGTGTTDGSPQVGTAPVEGYDSFSIPALRGHLRAYPAETVADLLDYERATRARAPYVTLLQNRLEKLGNDRG